VLNIEFDGEKPKVSLGIKQLVPDPWDRIPFDYPVGRIVDAKVIKVLDFGAFVEIEKGVEGLIHVSEFSDQRVEDPKNFVKPGQSFLGRARAQRGRTGTRRDGLLSLARPRSRTVTRRPRRDDGDREPVCREIASTGLFVLARIAMCEQRP
jgi:hypothetical protein